MANKKAVYAVETKVNTGQAAAEAKRLAAIFRAELRKISVGTTGAKGSSGGGNVAAAAKQTQAQVTAAVKQAQSAQTAIAKTEANIRLQVSRAESAERINDAKKTAAGTIESERRTTAALKEQIRQRARQDRLTDKAAAPKSSLLGTIGKGAAAYLTIQAATQIAQAAFALDDLRVKSLRAEVGFKILSGSAAQAGMNIRAIQSAAGGTIDRLTALQVGNQALALGLANTAEEFGQLTRAARAVSLISPIIHDVQGAISELALASANLSWRRLDQLGLSVSEVRDRFKEVQAANPEMDDSAAFLAASVEILNKKYGELLDTQEANASGAETLRVQYEDLKVAMATGPVGNAVDEFFQRIAESIREVQVLMGQGTGTQLVDELDQMIAALKGQQQENQTTLPNPIQAAGMLFGTRSYPAELETQIRRMEDGVRIVKELENAVERGVPGADATLAKAADIIGEVARNASAGKVDAFTRELSDEIQALAANYRQLTAGTSAYVDATAEAFAADKAAAEALAQEQIAVEELAKTYIEMGGDIGAFANGLLISGASLKDFNERIAGMEEFFSKRQGVRDSATSGASKLVEQFGVEEANRILEQQLQQIEITFQRFQRGGIRSGPLLDLGIADLQNQIAAQVDGIIAEADRLQEGANFDQAVSQINTALGQLNTGSFDGAEGIAAIRDELISLASSLSYSGAATDEQAARINYLAAVAFAASDSTSYLGQAQAILGIEFLNTNDYVGALTTEMSILDAAYANGSISASYHAAALIALVTEIYAAAQAAGVAAPQLAQLLALKNALQASSAGVAVGPDAGRGDAAARLAILRERAIAGQARREQLRDQQRAAQKENAKAQEKAARDTAKGFKSAASSAAKDFNNAAKSTKSAFEKAAQTLEAALRKVPGLFGKSEVTQEQLDLAKAGGSNNFADDYLRRLRDEVENGKDWADVSIEGAKEALGRIGIIAGGSQEQILAQFEEAWTNSSLFADKANLALINQDAVRQQLQIQDKIKQGQQNILDLFGATVDGVMAGVKAGDKVSIGLVANELEGSDDKVIREMAAGLREGKDSVIAKVLELATAELMDVSPGGGGGGGGGASAGGGGALGIDFDIPETPIFDPAEFYDNAVDPFIQAGAQLSSPEFFAGFDAFKKSAENVAEYTAALPPVSSLPAGQFGPLNKATTLPDMAAFGSLGPIAGPALTVDPTTATDYISALKTALTGAENAEPLAAIGRSIGDNITSGLGGGTFTDGTALYITNLATATVADKNRQSLFAVGASVGHNITSGLGGGAFIAGTALYITNLGTAFITQENSDKLIAIGSGVGAVIASGMDNAALSTLTPAYITALSNALYTSENFTLMGAIGKSIGGSIASGMASASMTTKATEYIGAIALEFEKTAGTSSTIGKTIGGQIAVGLATADFTGKANKYLTELDNAFDVSDKQAELGKVLGGQIAGGLDTAVMTTQVADYLTALDNAFDVSDKQAEIGKILGAQIAAGLATADFTDATAAYMNAMSTRMTPIAEVEGDDGKVRRKADFLGPTAADSAKVGKVIGDQVAAGMAGATMTIPATKYLTALDLTFDVIPKAYIGTTIGSQIAAGIAMADFTGAANDVIADIKAAFSTDSAAAGFRSLGAIAAEGAFAGFRATIAGQGWLAAIREELLADAMESLATSVEASLEATTVARSQ